MSYSSSTVSSRLLESCDDESDVELFEGSNISVSMFADQFTGLISECGLSDRAQKLTLNLIRTCLPRIHNMPCNNKLLAFQNQHFQVSRKTSAENGVVFGLDMTKQLKHLLLRHGEKLAQTESWQLQTDVKLPLPSNEVKTIYLLGNSDGVCPLKSVKLDIYPVWFQILNLHSVDRSRYSNLILAALFGGRGKPNWQELFESVKRDFGELEELSISVNETTYFVSMSTLRERFLGKTGLVKTSGFDAISEYA